MFAKSVLGSLLLLTSFSSYCAGIDSKDEVGASVNVRASQG